MATLAGGFLHELAGGGAVADPVRREQHANPQATQATREAQRGQRHDDAALALGHARSVDAVPFHAEAHGRLDGGGVEVGEEEHVVGVLLVVLEVADVADIDAGDVTDGEADLAKLSGEPPAQPFERLDLMRRRGHVDESLEGILGRDRLTAEVGADLRGGALAKNHQRLALLLGLTNLLRAEPQLA